MSSVAASYRELAKRFRHLPEEIVRAGARELQDSVLAQLKRDVGPDRKMSGFARSPGRHSPLGATVKVTPGTRIASAVVSASPAKFSGMWSILESGTKPHFVGELKRKQSGPGGKHMKIAGEWRTGPWRVRGAPAKYTWSEGVAVGVPAAERAMVQVWEDANG